MASWIYSTPGKEDTNNFGNNANEQQPCNNKRQGDWKGKAIRSYTLAYEHARWRSTVLLSSSNCNATSSSSSSSSTTTTTISLASSTTATIPPAATTATIPSTNFEEVPNHGGCEGYTRNALRGSCDEILMHRAHHSNSFLQIRPYAAETCKKVQDRRNFLAHIRNSDSGQSIRVNIPDIADRLSSSTGYFEDDTATKNAAFILPAVPSEGIQDDDTSVTTTTSSNDQPCPSPIEMSTSPSASDPDTPRTPSDMSISSSDMGDSASSVGGDDSSTTSALCTTPTTERDEFEEWESIIDDTVSSLTSGCSSPTLPGYNYSNSLFRRNFEAGTTSAGILRASSEFNGNELELTNSGDYEVRVDLGPCIFDDYSGHTKSRPCTSGFFSEAAFAHNDAEVCGLVGTAPDDPLIEDPGVNLQHSTSDSSLLNTSGTIDNLGSGTEVDRSECGNTSFAAGGPPSSEVCSSSVDHSSLVNHSSCLGNCEVSDPSHMVNVIVDGKPKLKAADLLGIVQRLTCDKHNDPEMTATCLLTYRLFTTAHTVFSLLKQRYLDTPNDMVRLKVCGVLKQWLEKHYSDFCDGQNGCSSTLLETLSSFLETVSLNHPTSAAQLKKLVDNKGVPRATTVILQTPVPQSPRIRRLVAVGTLAARGGNSGVGQDVHGHDVDMMRVPSVVVAQQLALMEFEWFRAIQPTEFLNNAWINRKDRAPNICNMIAHSNAVPYWVATEIVQRDNFEERVAILRKFISIANHCCVLHNYNALMEILSGLNMTAIFRLKKTWGALSPKPLAVFRSLNQLMSPEANFKAYREILKKVTQPRVPYLGRYLTDLVFTDDALPMHLPNGLIHFWKCKAIAQIVLDLSVHQKQPYTFEEVPEIQCYLQKSKGLTESALLKLSRKLEPKVI